MGIDTIKKAKKIIVMAWGESKAEIVKRTIEGE
jgi:glucosamine-6-phosphate deaminase